jgi:hypothetical protein
VRNFMISIFLLLLLLNKESCSGLNVKLDWKVNKMYNFVGKSNGK